MPRVRRFRFNMHATHTHKVCTGQTNPTCHASLKLSQILPKTTKLNLGSAYQSFECAVCSRKFTSACGLRTHFGQMHKAGGIVETDPVLNISYIIQLYIILYHCSQSPSLIHAATCPMILCQSHFLVLLVRKYSSHARLY